MNNQRSNWILLTLIVLFVAFGVGACFYQAVQQVRCNDRGGVYVRQFAGYECGSGKEMTLEWVGYRKLRPGRIHVWCPHCGRKYSNAHRSEYDPPRATLVHTWCDRCGSGGKESPETFFDADGKEISWEEVEENIARVVDLITSRGY